MRSESFELPKDYFYWLTQSSHAYQRLFNVLSARYGATFRQTQILGYLVKNHQMSQSELVNLLGVEAPTLVGLLDRMEKDGWVIRIASKTDRRRNDVQVGPRLESVWKDLIDCSKEARAKAADSISPEEMETLISLLKRVHTNLTVKSPEDPPATNKPPQPTGLSPPNPPDSETFLSLLG